MANPPGAAFLLLSFGLPGRKPMLEACSCFYLFDCLSITPKSAFFQRRKRADFGVMDRQSKKIGRAHV